MGFRKLPWRWKKWWENPPPLEETGTGGYSELVVLVVVRTIFGYPQKISEFGLAVF